MGSKHQNLIVWNKSIDLQHKIYDAIVTFPRDEDDVLTKELIDTSEKISENIVTGANEVDVEEFIDYIQVAISKCARLQSALHISSNQNYLTENEYDDLKNRNEEVAKMLYGLKRALRKRKTLKNKSAEDHST